MRAKVVYHKDGSQSFFVNGEKVTKRQYDKAVPTRHIDFAAGELPGLHMDYGDWSSENGGKGRYCPQKASGPKAADGYCRSRGELIEWANSRNKLVEKD
jgi:hypothetical protein